MRAVSRGLFEAQCERWGRSERRLRIAASSLFPFSLLDLFLTSSSSYVLRLPLNSHQNSPFVFPFTKKNKTKTRSFKVLEGGNDRFEVREYAPAVWSTTSFPAGTSWSEVRSKGFDRNFNYIKNAGVAMTAPVVSIFFLKA